MFKENRVRFFPELFYDSVCGGIEGTGGIGVWVRLYVEPLTSSCGELVDGLDTRVRDVLDSLKL